MPRPITKADIKRWRGGQLSVKFRVYTDDRLGIYIGLIDLHAPNYFCYSADAKGLPVWVVRKTIEKRKKLGHPGKRKKPRRMVDSMFSLEEMELACSIMEKLSDG